MGLITTVMSECRRILKPTGLLWLNIGDTASGSGGAGGDYNAGGAKEGRPKWKQGKTGLPNMTWCNIPARVSTMMLFDEWLLRSEIIWDKCLSGGTKVYAKTPFGEGPRPLDDLWRKRHLPIEVWTGEMWTPIRSWRQVERPEEGSLEITLRSGEVIGCTHDHIWMVADRQVEAKDLIVGMTLDSTTLPQPSPPTSPALLSDNEIGWFIGFYMAEGNKQPEHGLVFTVHADEVEFAKRIITTVEALGGTATFTTRGNVGRVNCFGRIPRAAVETYVSGDTSKTKHLTWHCWQRSNKFLMALLHGWLDGDGHFEAANGRFIGNITDNDKWISDLRTIANRLHPYSFRARRSINHNQHGEFPGWKWELRQDQRQRRTSDTQIVAISKGRARKFYDISLDAPHVFALASGVISHNCIERREDLKHVRRVRPAHEMIYCFAKHKGYRWDHEGLAETGSVWHFAPSSGKGRGPAPFPFELVERCLRPSGIRPGDVVVDPFAGVGTTLVVAEEFFGATAIGFDLYTEDDDDDQE